MIFKNERGTNIKKFASETLPAAEDRSDKPFDCRKDIPIEDKRMMVERLELAIRNDNWVGYVADASKLRYLSIPTPPLSQGQKKNLQERVYMPSLGFQAGPLMNGILTDPSLFESLPADTRAHFEQLFEQEAEAIPDEIDEDERFSLTYLTALKILAPTVWKLPKNMAAYTPIPDEMPFSKDPDKAGQEIWVLALMRICDPSLAPRLRPEAWRQIREIIQNYPHEHTKALLYFCARLLAAKDITVVERGVLQITDADPEPILPKTNQPTPTPKHI